MINTSNEKLEVGIKKARELFKKFAEDNYLELVEEYEDGDYYENEDYLDYQDISSIEETIKSETQKGIAQDEILDGLYDFYIDMNGDIEGTEYFINKFLEENESELEELFKGTEYEDIPNNLFYNDNIAIRNTIDYKSILKNTEIDVLVYLENEESFDQEFSNNNFTDMFMYNNDYYDLMDVLVESSARTLLESQGYTVEDFAWYHVVEETNFETMEDMSRYADLEEDKVFTSIYEEITNAQNLQSLVVPMKVTLSDLEEMKSKDSITIPKDSVVGYFGAVDGSGSIFNVKLNNTIELSKENYEIIVDGRYGYKMEDVYGNFILD